MIWTIFKIQCYKLWNRPAELAMILVVPLIFFSIFAAIFGSRERNVAGNKIKVAICDLAQTDSSQAIIKDLQSLDSLKIFYGLSRSSSADPVKPEQAIDWVRRGLVSVAIVLKEPRGTPVGSNPPKQNGIEVSPAGNARIECQLLADSLDQVAPQVIAALVQKSMLLAMPMPPDTMHRDEQLQFAAVETGREKLPPTATATASHEVTLAAHREATWLPTVHVQDILGGRKANPIIAMYAAGIAVMFLLFTASTSGGTLLDEKENGTLHRLLASRMTLDELLMGKWLFLTLQGFLQVTLMFSFGAAIFGVELAKHLDGFFAMTLVTASAGSSLALLMAAACRTRSQMNWVSVVVILSMSALGGSMVPRYLMSESMQKIGWGTFNAWALEGYQKVFWRDLPVVELGKELAILTACAVGFLVAARYLMARWIRE